MRLVEEVGGLDNYLWSRVNWTPVLRTGREHVAASPLGDEISKDLKKRGFKFVGPTIIYAYLQAVGIVNDHDENCFCCHSTVLRGGSSSPPLVLASAVAVVSNTDENNAPNGTKKEKKIGRKSKRVKTGP